MLCIYARCRQEIPDGSLYCPWCGRKQTRETKKRHRRTNGTGSVYKNSGTRKRSKPWVALKDGRSIGQCFATEAEAKAALDALGIPRHTPHGTRRTTATMAVEARVDPAALQKVGGWKEFDTIQRHYNKPDIEYLYREMEKLEDIRKERSGGR